jgi:hypothetical protein
MSLASLPNERLSVLNNPFLSDGQRYKNRRAAPINQKKKGVSFFNACQQAVQGLYIAYRAFIDFKDDVTGYQSGLVSR